MSTPNSRLRRLRTNRLFRMPNSQPRSAAKQAKPAAEAASICRWWWNASGGAARDTAKIVLLV
jgi:hypothetical protein